MSANTFSATAPNAISELKAKIKGFLKKKAKKTEDKPAEIVAPAAATTAPAPAPAGMCYIHLTGLTILTIS